MSEIALVNIKENRDYVVWKKTHINEIKIETLPASVNEKREENRGRYSTITSKDPREIESPDCFLSQKLYLFSFTGALSKVNTFVLLRAD